MFETHENTPTRQVFTIGSRMRTDATVSLDKTAGTARIERRILGIPRRAIELPFADIVAADPITITVYSPEQYVLVRTKAGKKIWLPADSTDTSIAAAKQIREFVGLPEPEPGADPVPKSTRWLTKIAGGVLTLVAIIGGISWLVRTFTTPSCDASVVLTTARDLLKRGVKEEFTITEPTLAAESGKERLCRAVLTIQGDTATFGYRVYKDGLTTMVQMLGVVGTETIEAGRIDSIKTAARGFLDRARDAYRTGNPPRRSDATVRGWLDLIFGTSIVADKTLAPSEIPLLLDWFDAGDRVGSIYVIAGTGYEDPGKVPATPEMQTRMQDNVVRNADEFGRYVDFQVTLLATTAKAIASAQNNSFPEDWEKSTAKAKQPNVQADLSQTMGSALIALAYAGYDDNWRMARIATLKAVAPVAATFLTAEQAKSVRERALQVVEYQRAQGVKDELGKLADLVAKP